MRHVLALLGLVVVLCAGQLAALWLAGAAIPVSMPAWIAIAGRPGLIGWPRCGG